ncbi:MAG: hypothetical protein WA071_14805 [Undibacterium umbellatum]|uniref:hypothetical protein n=1 Tax=Undibacterium umbellatum TaxID=2762300 RepID=UPI003BB68EAE
MITKQQILKAVPDVQELAQWAPGVAPMGWTVRVEDGNLQFNENLHRDYRAALTLVAAEKLKEAGFDVTQPSLSYLIIN